MTEDVRYKSIGHLLSSTEVKSTAFNLAPTIENSMYRKAARAYNQYTGMKTGNEPDRAMPPRTNYTASAETRATFSIF